MVIEGRIDEEAETMTTGMLTGIPKFMREEATRGCRHASQETREDSACPDPQP